MLDDDSMSGDDDDQLDVKEFFSSLRFHFFFSPDSQ
jgi:hypothetical protein